MSAERATYLDSSAIVKLVVHERESSALRRYVSGKRPLVASALVRTEVLRALFDVRDGFEHAEKLFRSIELLRVNDRTLRTAGRLLPAELKSLDAIHLATAATIGSELARVCTYDDRMIDGAKALGMRVVSPGRRH